MRKLALSVISQEGESQNGCFKKSKHAKFSKKQTFLTPRYAHVRLRIRWQEIIVWHLPFWLITDNFEIENYFNVSFRFFTSGNFFYIYFSKELRCNKCKKNINIKVYIASSCSNLREGVCRRPFRSCHQTP